MIAEKKEDFKSFIINANKYSIDKVLNYINKKGGLTKEESFLLFELYLEEKEKGVSLEDCIYRTILIYAYDKFVSFMLNKMNIYDEDCNSAGKYGLIRAIDSFDVSRDITFMTYASQCIKNEVFMYLRKERPHSLISGRVVSFDDAVNDKDEHYSLYEVFKSEDTELRRVEDIDEVDSVIKKFRHLSPTEQYCLMAHSGIYGTKLTQYDISLKLNVSQSYVSRKLSSCYEKIKILTNPNNLTKEQEILYYEITHKSYKILSKEEFLNYNHKEQKVIKPIVFDEARLITKDIKKKEKQINKPSIQIKEKETEFNVKSYLKSIPKEEIDRYTYMLRFLRPLEQACVIYRYGLWGKQLFNCKAVAEKINWNCELLEPHYKRAINKIKLLIKFPKNMTEQEKKEFKELTRSYYEPLTKESLRKFGKNGRNCIIV